MSNSSLYAGLGTPHEIALDVDFTYCTSALNSLSESLAPLNLTVERTAMALDQFTINATIHLSQPINYINANLNLGLDFDWATAVEQIPEIEDTNFSTDDSDWDIK